MNSPRRAEGRIKYENLASEMGSFPRLLSSDRSSEIGHNPPQESVVRGEADKQLELVVLSQTRARCLDPGNQFRVHSAGKM